MGDHQNMGGLHMDEKKNIEISASTLQSSAGPAAGSGRSFSSLSWSSRSHWSCLVLGAKTDAAQYEKQLQRKAMTR